MLTVAQEFARTLRDLGIKYVFVITACRSFVLNSKKSITKTITEHHFLQIWINHQIIISVCRFFR